MVAVASSLDKTMVVISSMLGAPRKRPSQGHAALVADGAIVVEIQKLHHKVVILTACDSSVPVRATKVAYELHQQLQLPHWSISVSPHKPEHFLV
jgi:hypothetical protein